MQGSQSFIPNHSSLTEDEVKRRFMPFLRDFYKNRYEPSPNTVSVELDNVSKEGWVADGKITFRKADGSPFICTYEATSRDKAEEVLQPGLMHLLAQALSHAGWGLTTAPATPFKKPSAPDAFATAQPPQYLN